MEIIQLLTGRATHVILDASLQQITCFETLRELTHPDSWTSATTLLLLPEMLASAASRAIFWPQNEIAKLYQAPTPYTENN